MKGFVTLTGSVGCFIAGGISIISPLYGIPFEMAYGLFFCSVGVMGYGVYRRGRIHHREAQEVRNKPMETIDKAFFRVTHKGKKVSRLGSQMK